MCARVNASQCLAEIWRNRSILGQILAVMIGIELGAAIIGAAAIVYAQRQQNEAEMSAGRSPPSSMTSLGRIFSGFRPSSCRYVS